MIIEGKKEKKRILFRPLGVEEQRKEVGVAARGVHVALKESSEQVEPPGVALLRGGVGRQDRHVEKDFALLPFGQHASPQAESNKYESEQDRTTLRHWAS